MILLDKFHDDDAPIPNAFESTSQRVNESTSRDVTLIWLINLYIKMTKSYFNHIMVRLILLSHQVNKFIIKITENLKIFKFSGFQFLRFNKKELPFHRATLNCQLSTVNC